MLESTEATETPQNLSNVSYYFSDVHSIWESQNTAQHPYTKRRAESNHACKIQSIGNKLVPKLDNAIKLYFENVNGLPK